MRAPPLEPRTRKEIKRICKCSWSFQNQLTKGIRVKAPSSHVKEAAGGCGLVWRRTRFRGSMQNQLTKGIRVKAPSSHVKEAAGGCGLVWRRTRFRGSMCVCMVTRLLGLRVGKQTILNLRILYY